MPQEGVFETFGNESENVLKTKSKPQSNDYGDVSIPDLMVQVRRPRAKKVIESSRNSV